MIRARLLTNVTLTLQITDMCFIHSLEASDGKYGTGIISLFYTMETAIWVVTHI